MTSIVFAGGIIEPTVVLGYSSRREARNITHPILGRSNPDVTIRPADPRTGTLTLGFEGADSESDSKAAEDAHATGAVFGLIDSDRASVAMYYFANGGIVRELEDETRDAWVVTVDFQEIDPE